MKLVDLENPFQYKISRVQMQCLKFKRVHKFKVHLPREDEKEDDLGEKRRPTLKLPEILTFHGKLFSKD
jgi:hypothetical protein